MVGKVYDDFSPSLFKQLFHFIDLTKNSAIVYDFWGNLKDGKNNVEKKRAYDKKKIMIGYFFFPFIRFSCVKQIVDSVLKCP